MTKISPADEGIEAARRDAYLARTDKEVIFEYLDNLRESGVTNMFGAGPYVEAEFGLGRREAGNMVGEWMKTFSERHPK